MALTNILSSTDYGRNISSTGNEVFEVQILEPQSPALYVVCVLSCPLIGSCSSSTANQRAAQNNCYIKPDLEDSSICTT